MALRAHSQQPKTELSFLVRGQDGNRTAMNAARELRALDETVGNARDVVKDAHIVITSLPPGVIHDVYEYFAPNLKPGAVVLDMSVFKQAIVDLARSVFVTGEDGKPVAHLVGIQPLVHNDYLFEPRMDVDAADVHLFTGSDMLIVPDVRASQDAVKLATDLAEILQMQPRYLTTDEYDSVADFTERLPLLLGFALFASMHTAPGRLDLMRAVNPNLALMMHALRDAEGSDLHRMWRYQPENTHQRLDELIAMLSHLRDTLTAEDDDAAREDIDATLKAFRNWQTRRAQRDWDTYQDDKPKATQFGLFGALGNLFGGGRPRDEDQPSR